MNTFYLGLIVVVYLLSLSFLGYLGYKKTTSASDYLVGGRNMNPIVMSLSYGATFISASAIVGFGGAAAAYGMGLQWLCLLKDHQLGGCPYLASLVLVNHETHGYPY